MGEAATFPANAKATGYWFPVKERGLATAIFDASAKFAPAIGAPLIGYLMFKTGWRVSFAVTGVLSLCYFALFYRFYRNPSEDKHLSDREREFIREGGARPEQATRSHKGRAAGFTWPGRRRSSAFRLVSPLTTTPSICC